MLATPCVRKVKGASRSHEHASASSTFLDVFGSFARQVIRLAAHHYSVTCRLPPIHLNGINAVIRSATKPSSDIEILRQLYF